MAIGHSLIDEIKPAQVYAPVSLAASTVTSSVSDMLGWDGILYLIELGVISAGGTFDAKVQRDDNSGFSSATDISGAALTQVTQAGGGSSKLYCIQVYRPSERYLRLSMTEGTAAALVGVTAVQYRGQGLLPATQVAAQSIKVVEN